MSGIVRVDTIELDSWAVTWANVGELLDEWSASWRYRIDDARTDASHQAYVADEVHSVASAMHDVAARLRRAAQTYAEFDAVNTLVMQRASDVGLWLAGRFLPVTVMWCGPLALGGAMSILLSRVILDALPPQMRMTLERAQTRAWASVLSTPAVVRTIELALGSLDEGVMGATGVPLPLALGVGSAGLGLTSLAGTSRVASRINNIAADPPAALPASAGAGTSIATEVQRISTEPVAAPRDVPDLLSRIPQAGDDGAQVRIEEFGDMHVIYIGGTMDAALGAGEQPWDMSSNLAALGGDASASEDAVRRAMSNAGIGRGDPVILVGHSQGGLVAARLAQAEDVNASAVITAGAPIHGMNLPARVPVVAFEHTDDLVPALGGTITQTQTQPSLVYVRRTALEGGVIDDETMLPAHRLETYVQSAQRSHGSENPTLERVRREISNLTPTGTSTLWRATRIAGER